MNRALIALAEVCRTALLSDYVRAVLKFTRRTFRPFEVEAEAFGFVWKKSPTEMSRKNFLRNRL